MPRLHPINHQTAKPVQSAVNTPRNGRTLCAPTGNVNRYRSYLYLTDGITAEPSQKETGFKRVETMVSILLPQREAEL